MNNYDDLFDQLADDNGQQQDGNKAPEMGVEDPTGPDVEGTQGNGQQVEPVKPAETASPEPATEPAEPAANNPDPEPAAQPVQANEPAQAQPSFDWEKVSGLSEGLVKDEETFRSIVDQSKRTSELEKSIEDLKSQQPVNDFVSKLNGLFKNGASQEQVDAFLEVNRVDLTTLDPKEALIQKAILIDGKTRGLAEFEIRSAYGLSDYEEGTEDYKALQDKIAYDGSKALKDLEAYKAEKSTFVNEEAQKQEAERLERVANDKKYQELINTEAPKLAQNFDGKITVNDGEKDHEIVMSPEFKEKLPEVIKEYFSNTKEPINQETLAKLGKHIENVYFVVNKDAIFKDMRNKIASEMEEKLANKYENRGGLKPNEQKPGANRVNADPEQDVADIYGLDRF